MICHSIRALVIDALARAYLKPPSPVSSDATQVGSFEITIFENMALIAGIFVCTCL
jgi:hypothetical protein